MTTILKPHQELANQYLSQLQIKQRPSGDKFICRTDDSTQEFEELIRDIHDTMMPDDYKYQFVYGALLTILESDDLDDCILNSGEWSNYEQAMWLASRGDRREYVDQVIAQYPTKLFIGKALEYAIDSEMDEVLQTVKTFIESKLEE